MAVALDVQLTEEDHLSATYAHLRRGGLARVLRLAMLALYALIVLGLLFALALGKGNPTALGVWVLMGFWLSGIYYWYIPWASRRYFRQYESMRLVQRYEANDSGLQIRGEHGEARLEWGDFVRWKEGRQEFLLYVNSRQYLIFPKRCFRSENDMLEFRRLAQSGIGFKKARSIG